MRLLSLALIAACAAGSSESPRTQAVPTTTSSVWTETSTSTSTEPSSLTIAWTLDDVPNCAGPDAIPVDMALVNGNVWVLLSDERDFINSACLIEVRPDGTILEATQWNLGGDTTPGAVAIHEDGTPWVVVHHDGDLHIQSWSNANPVDEVVRPGLHDPTDMQSLDFTRNGFLMLGYLTFDEVDTSSGQDCMLRTYKPDPDSGLYSILDIQSVSRLPHVSGDDTCGEFVTRDDGLVQHALAPIPSPGGYADLALYLQDQTVPSFWMTGLFTEGAVPQVERGQMLALPEEGVLLSTQSAESTDSSALTLGHILYIDGYGQPSKIATDDQFRVWARDTSNLVSARIPIGGGTLAVEILDPTNPFGGPVDGLELGTAGSLLGVEVSTEAIYVLSQPTSGGTWELWALSLP